MAKRIRELSELPRERVEMLTGHRFVVTNDEKLVVVDTERIADFDITPIEEIDTLACELVKDLALIANHRVHRYDGLLNSVEAWTKIFRFIEHIMPQLRSSGVLQPLTDLDACLHDLVVGRPSGLVVSRDALFDGGYRWIESYDLARSEGEEPREPSKRTIRTYQDMMEGRITLAWLALKHGLPKNKIAPTIEKLLKAAEIRNCDDQLEYAITADTVRQWFDSVREKGRALGRRYCYEADVERFKSQLVACKGHPEVALKFARDQLEWVRCRQPTNRPITDKAKETSRIVERTGRWKSRQGK